MKKLAIHLVFASLIAVLTPMALEAKHIIGGVFTYKCLGDGAPGFRKYRFTMKVYRDCFGGGAAFDTPAQFAIFRGTSAGSIMVASLQVDFSDYNKLEPDTPRCVAQIPNVCVEEATYTFDRDLQISQTESYFVVYQRCCRNETIKNIFTPGDIGATFMVELTPNAQALCNNSPEFNNFPPIIICNNVPLEFDHSATDPDGDQLFYSFCPPLLGGGNILTAPDVFSCDGAIPSPPCGPPFSTATFIGPDYTVTNPMGGSPLISIDPQTGIITGTPNQVGQYVVGVCVREFRNGVLLSTVQREFQFNVADCSPTVLAIIDTATLLQGQYNIISCGSKKVRIGNKSFQKSNIDYFLWEFDMGMGNVFKDSTNWEFLNITFPDTGVYKGRLLLNPGETCGDTAQLNVLIYPQVTADFAYDYDTCVAGPVIFTDKSFGDGIVEKWNWNFGVPNATSTDKDPQYTYGIPGNHPVTLRVTDRNKCADDTTQVIQYFPVPPLIILEPDAYAGCVPQEIFFNNLSVPIDETYNIQWDFGDGSTQLGPVSPKHLYTEPGVFDVSVKITSPLGCYTEAAFPNLIRMEPSPTAGFTCDPMEGLTNLNSTVQFIDQSQDANRWNWTFDRFGTSTETNPAFTFPDTGLMRVRLIVTHPRGCKDSLTKFLDIRPEIRWYMPNAFTPNGDAKNEGFQGKGFLFGATNFRMSIWNRWGEMVYETSNPDDAWDGREQKTGKMSPAGVYVYLVSFRGPRGEPFEFKGFATLIL
jgi:gliding motility-associated-like protein